MQQAVPSPGLPVSWCSLDDEGFDGPDDEDPDDSRVFDLALMSDSSDSAYTVKLRNAEIGGWTIDVLEEIRREGSGYRFHFTEDYMPIAALQLSPTSVMAIVADNSFIPFQDGAGQWQDETDLTVTVYNFNDEGLLNLDGMSTHSESILDVLDEDKDVNGNEHHIASVFTAISDLAAIRSVSAQEANEMIKSIKHMEDADGDVQAALTLHRLTR